MGIPKPRFESLHVLVDASHLEWLKIEGARRHVSISDLVREILAARIDGTIDGRKRLMSIAGIIKDGGLGGKRHDGELYGRSRRS